MHNHFQGHDPLLDIATVRSLADSIKARLHELFPHKPIPANPGGQHYMEVQDFWQKFRRTSWIHIEPAQIRNHFDVLLHLDERAYAHYLPAFINCTLHYVKEGPDDWPNFYFWLQNSFPDPSTLPPKFTLDQSRLIADFLLLMTACEADSQTELNRGAFALAMQWMSAALSVG